ncbi:MAG: hypothetical protein ACI9LV_000960 [Candidatus Nanohaloarchaea archaeon]|jgi:hypothetical protein
MLETTDVIGTYSDRSLERKGEVDDLPEFNYWEGDEETYSEISELEDRIIETFAKYEESGLTLDTENMLEVAVKWRQNAKKLLEEEPVTDSQLGDAYIEAIEATYDKI